MHARLVSHARLVCLSGLICPVLAVGSLCPAQTLNWAEVKTTSSPSARERLAMTFDTDRQLTVLFGGWDGTRYLNDTWEWDGAFWKHKNTKTKPWIRERHSLAFDTVRKRAVVFGGWSGSAYWNDTWEYDGTDWKEIKTTTQPSRRWNRSMVYDEARQRMVLFGGRNGSGYQKDTWEFDGANWKRIVTSTTPPARNGQAMSYDAGRKRTVMFGGWNGIRNLDDTWEYDGIQWTRIQPVFSPPAGRDYSMIYDSTRGKSVLFGGWNGTSYWGDTWEWDGTSWTPLGTTARPPARNIHGMAYDGDVQRTVLFGGWSGKKLLADTWELGGPRQSLNANTLTVSVATGGTQTLALNASSRHAQQLYWVLGSVTGTKPGIRVGGVHLPLNPDIWTDITVAFANSPMLKDTRGKLDAKGRAQAFFNVPRVQNAQAIGLVFYHAFIVYDTQNTFRLASNPVTLTLVAPKLGRVVEDFTNDSKLDKTASAGTWGNNKVTFGRIGGDGADGEFDHTHGKLLSTNVYQWSTDGGTTIPKTVTLDNKDHRITDGVFNFSTFVLPAGVTVHFVGTKPLQINVTGEVHIRGRMLLNGVDLLKDAHKGSNRSGEQGSIGGPGGGRGGNGADAGDGVSNKANFNGQDGADVQLLAGHAYANNAPTTGGPGSPQHPADGKQSSVVFTLFSVICAMATSGGGGGGNLLAGKDGTAVWTGSQAAKLNKEVAPDTKGGTGLGWQAIKPSNKKSLDHYTVGGSGGGGGGSHPLASIAPSSSGPKISFNSGRAGAGGGGAVAIRSGRMLTMAAGSLIQARGGSASPNLSNAFADQDPSPGAGGSGGTIFFQVDGGTDMKGTLDVTGGTGGELVDAPTFGDKITIKGGDGGAGVIRMETVGTLNKSRLGNTTPVAAKDTDVQPLSDLDNLVAVRSQWYAASLIAKPNFVRYEIEAKVDGKTVIYSDDTKVGIRAARGATPVFILVQGAEVRLGKNAAVEPIPNTIKPWRPFVGRFSAGNTLAEDGASGYRFTLVLDRSFGKTVEVKKVTVYFEV